MYRQIWVLTCQHLPLLAFHARRGRRGKCDKMSKETGKRKVDKRTINTKASIRKAMLDLMRGAPFSTITVKELCERVEINRTTFYIHYHNTTDVLVELIDEVLETEIKTNDSNGKTPNEGERLCPYRLCDKVHTKRQLGVVFFDESLKPLVIERISNYSKEDCIRNLMRKYNLNKSDAESIYYFQINGCLAVNKLIYQRGSNNWEHTNELIESFMKNGLDLFKRP